MNKLFSSLCFILLAYSTFGQTSGESSQKPRPRDYKFFEYTFAPEINFSFSNTTQNDEGIRDIVRFAPFFNGSEQLHFNIARPVGIYTGLGIKNIGFIARPTLSDGSEIKVKQRVYSLYMPLAIKLGNMGKHRYLAAGGELNMFFNYKEKVFQNGTKSRNSEWFSDKVELFNPAFFIELVGSYSFIKFTWYPNNFVKEQSNYEFVNDPNKIALNYPSQSSVFSISVGWIFMNVLMKEEHIYPIRQQPMQQAMY